MRLIKADCGGYRRFRGRTELDLGPDLVCIVGPNAAGKSSFLKALTHLEHDDDYEPQERTRNAPTKLSTYVQARYALDDAEKLLLKDIPEAKDARQLLVWKMKGHSVGAALDPKPQRDLRPRADVRKRVELLQADPWSIKKSATDDNEQTPFEERVDTAVNSSLEALRSDKQSLTPEAIATLNVLLNKLSEAALPHRYRGLPSRLEELVRHEGLEHPHRSAVDILLPNRPPFRIFDDDTRNLAATYDLNGDGDQAIRNLLELAGTSWVAAQSIVQSGDKGRKNTFLDRANKRLAETLTEDWGQGDLTIRLDLDKTVLTILMRMQTDDFIDIDQQSDGLRQFVALRAFVALEPDDVKPIVLIDEAETHLHYDAQADLVHVLERQTDADKIIYTTHSAGCLPHDLGTGIRAIVPKYETMNNKSVRTDDSTVINKFWTRGRGYSPLLIAMGASSFAFAAMQRAAIAEGMSDTMLLPTLLREATGASRLPYQVAPHFAEAREDEIADLDLIASRVVYLADGDDGGREHVKKLLRSGVREDQIVWLGDKHSGLSLEDLLTKKSYLRAVNEELARWHSNHRYPADKLPQTGRGKAVADWCKRRRDSDGNPIELSKVAVAQQLLDQVGVGPLLAQAHLETLRDLHQRITEVLSKAAERNA